MDRETLEHNDLKLRQKVGMLRSNLAYRQRTYDRKRKARLGLNLGICLLLVAAVGYYVTDNTVRSRQSPPPVALQNRPTPTVASRDFLPLSTPSLPVVSPEPLAVESLAPAPPPAPEMQAMGTLETPSPAHTPALVDMPSVLAGPPDRVAGTPRDIPDATGVTAVTPGSSSPAVPRPARPRIVQSLTCLKVEDRQCVGVRSVFALRDHSNPHVWMDVRSQALPDVLKHVYYHNGQKYSEVTLPITYPRMRTWSNITLHGPVQMGDWQVAITTEEGTILTQLAFRVIP